MKVDRRNPGDVSTKHSVHFLAVMVEVSRLDAANGLPLCWSPRCGVDYAFSGYRYIPPK